jgi:hypothetical protein
MGKINKMYEGGPTLKKGEAGKVIVAKAEKKAKEESAAPAQKEEDMAQMLMRHKKEIDEALKKYEKGE